MLPISTVITLLFGHWVANYFYLYKHITVETTWDNRVINSVIYTCMLGLFSYWVLPVTIFYWFLVLSGVFHYIVTSYTNKHIVQLFIDSKFEEGSLPSLSMFNIISLIHVLQYIIIFSTYTFLMS